MCDGPGRGLILVISAIAEAEIKRMKFETNTNTKLGKPHLKKQAVHGGNASYFGGTGRGIAV
jgi:hypothetical protein